MDQPGKLGGDQPELKWALQVAQEMCHRKERFLLKPKRKMADRKIDDEHDDLRHHLAALATVDFP